MREAKYFVEKGKHLPMSMAIIFFELEKVIRKEWGGLVVQRNGHAVVFEPGNMKIGCIERAKRIRTIRCQ